MKIKYDKCVLKNRLGIRDEHNDTHAGQPAQMGREKSVKLGWRKPLMSSHFKWDEKRCERSDTML